MKPDKNTDVLSPEGRSKRLSDTSQLSLTSAETSVLSVDPDQRSQESQNSVEKPKKSVAAVFVTDLKVYLRELSETVEVHGLMYLFEEGRSLLERLFWLIIIICSLVVCLLLIRPVKKYYEDNQIIVDIGSTESLIFEIPFPAVTICPFEKTHSTKSLDFIKIRDYYKKHKNFASEEEFKYFQYFLMVCDRSLYEYENFFDDGIDDAFREDFFDTMREYCPEVDKIISNCMYLGLVLNCSKIFKPIYTNLGLCYSFNMIEGKEIYTDDSVYSPGFFEAERHGSSWSPENGTITTTNFNVFPRRGYRAGSMNAFSLDLHQRKDFLDYACTFGLHGFKVSVHDPSQVPNFIDYNIHISMSTSVVVQIMPSLLTATKEIEKLPVDTRNCFKGGERSLKFYRIYSRNNCVKECLSNYTINMCGCVAYDMPRASSTRICGVSKLRCILEAETSFKYSKVKKQLKDQFRVHEHFGLCNCKPHCFQLKYLSKVYVSRTEFVVKTGENFSGIWQSRLSVYFQTASFRKLQRIEHFGIDDLMAYIGGMVNFFIGSSVLTLAEIIYTFTLKIMCNKLIYGPWAGPAALNYEFDPN